MSQLVLIKNRIKAIETIEKTTHAMRLVSMSNHMRLRDQEPYRTNYQNIIKDLFQNLVAKCPTWKHFIFNPTPNSKNLIIIIGSQKGLCGNFNHALFNFFKSHFSVIDPEKTDIISVGKKTEEYLSICNLKPIKSYNTFSPHNTTIISQKITQYLSKKENQYNSISIINNYQKTFFTQKQALSIIVPLENTKKETDTIQPKQIEEYTWLEEPHDILNRLIWTYLEVIIEYHLFQSILSEQAARFVSMDNSTRNAQETLITMHKQYNKLRQAKITKELTELSTSFQFNNR